MRKIFVIFLSLFFASCSAKEEQQTKIRIVDLQGKPHSVTTKTPELNNQALAMQGKMRDGRNNFANEVKKEEKFPQNFAQQDADFGAVSSEAIQKTLQFSKQPTEKNSEKSDNSIVSAGASEDKNQTVEYDLLEGEEKTKKPAKSKKVLAKKSAVTKKFFAQVGSFSNSGNAKQTLNEMAKFHKGRIEVVEGEKTIYRVLIGPFSNKAQANEMVKKISNSGREAILVRSK
jgi:cell division septation protein DedD